MWVIFSFLVITYLATGIIKNIIQSWKMLERFKPSEMFMSVEELEEDK